MALHPTNSFETTAIPTSREIPTETIRLHESLERLAEGIFKLADLMQPALCPEEKVETSGATAPSEQRPTTVLGRAVRDASDRVLTACNLIESLRTRLEL